MKGTNPRLLLARLRDGNYAHPGDSEAVELFMHHLERHQNTSPLHILDVGCGRGGTADYIKTHNPHVGSITGIDMDAVAIGDAKSAYENIDFHVCNISDVDQLTTKKFDLIYMFSVFYALPESLQKESLQKLAHIAQDGAILAISDYILLHDDPVAFHDFSGKPMKPPSLENLKLWLKEAGWELLEQVELNEEYHRWYDDFLKKLHSKKAELLTDFTEETVTTVNDTFQLILNKIDDGLWGGSILYSKLNKHLPFFSPKSEGMQPPLPELPCGQNSV